MKKLEYKLILDLYKHYKSISELTDNEIKSLYFKYGSIRNILRNLIQEFEPETNITEEYLDEKLRIYGISEVEEIKNVVKNEEATDEIELEINEVEDKKVSKSKKNIFILLTFIFAIVIIGWFQINKKEAKDNINNGNNAIEENQSTNNSENNATNFKVICEEKRVNSTTSEPILIKSCILNNFKSVSTGEADYKGRYSYKYEIFIKKNGAFVKSNNEDLFNEKKEELLKLINKKIKMDFDDYATNPETKDCFEGVTFTYYTYENLGIEFNDDKVDFNVWFDVFEYCFNVSSTTVSFSIEELKPYLTTKYH
jgi:hypothetical protein